MVNRDTPRYFPYIKMEVLLDIGDIPLVAYPTIRTFVKNDKTRHALASHGGEINDSNS